MTDASSAPAETTSTETMPAETTLATRINHIIQQGVAMTGGRSGGFEVLSVNLPQVTCILPYHAKHIRPGNTISGPTLMTLADAAMYAVVLALDERQIMAVTHDFQIHFLARPEPKDLTAVATLLKAGKRSVVMRVDLYSGEKLVAHCTGSYALMQNL